MTARIMLLPFCAAKPVRNPKRGKLCDGNVVFIQSAHEAKKGLVQQVRSPLEIVTKRLDVATKALQKSGTDDDRQQVERELISVMLALMKSPAERL